MTEIDIITAELINCFSDLLCIIIIDIKSVICVGYGKVLWNYATVRG